MTTIPIKMSDPPEMRWRRRSIWAKKPATKRSTGFRGLRLTICGARQQALTAPIPAASDLRFGIVVTIKTICTTPVGTRVSMFLELNRNLISEGKADDDPDRTERSCCHPISGPRAHRRQRRPVHPSRRRPTFRGLLSGLRQSDPDHPRRTSLLSKSGDRSPVFSGRPELAMEQL